MKTTLGDSYVATFYVDTEPGELAMGDPHTFEVQVNLRALGPLYRASLRSVDGQATLRAPGRLAGTEKAIVVRVVK